MIAPASLPPPGGRVLLVLSSPDFGREIEKAMWAEAVVRLASAAEAYNLLREEVFDVVVLEDTATEGETVLGDSATTTPILEALLFCAKTNQPRARRVLLVEPDSSVGSGSHGAPERVHRLIRKPVDASRVAGLSIELVTDKLRGKGRSDRVPARFSVRIHVMGGYYEAIAYNLSDTGMLVLVDPSARDTLRLAGRVEVDFAIPGANHTLRTPAAVVRLQSDAQDARGTAKLGLGLRFDGLTPEQAALIDGMIADAERHLIVFAGFPEGVRLTDDDQADLRAVSVSTAEEVVHCLEENEVAVMVVGPAFQGAAAKELVEQVQATLPGASTVYIVSSAGHDLSLFDSLVESEKIYYLLKRPVSQVQLIALCRSAAERHTRKLDTKEPAVEAAQFNRLARTLRIIEAADQVTAQRSLADAVRLAEHQVRSLVNATRAYLLLYDSGRELLFRQPVAGTEEQGDMFSATAGIAGYAARTGLPASVANAASDPRYDREIDDPEGTGWEKCLVEPVLDHQDRTIAVIVVIRLREQERFEEREIEMLRSYATQVSHAFTQMLVRGKIDEIFADRTRRQQEGRIFRAEAVAETIQGSAHGGILEVERGWLRVMPWLLVAMVLAAIIYSAVGEVKEYAEGPAVLRIHGRQTLAADTQGIVTSVDVVPGQRVSPGQPLVRFDASREEAELERIDREFTIRLVDRLRNPTDAQVESALAALRAERDLAATRVESRTVLSPSDGVVSDVRVRAGQYVEPGEALASLATTGSKVRLVALLPGEHRPRLKPGQAMRLELAGFHRVYQSLTTTSVAEEVIGPSEAQRFLGAEIADSIVPSGAVVIVEAELPGRSFRANGRTYEYHEGMIGRAQVPVASRSILLTLIPGLRALESGDN